MSILIDDFYKPITEQEATTMIGSLFIARRRYVSLFKYNETKGYHTTNSVNFLERGDLIIVVSVKEVRDDSVQFFEVLTKYGIVYIFAGSFRVDFILQ